MKKHIKSILVSLLLLSCMLMVAACDGGGEKITDAQLKPVLLGVRTNLTLATASTKDECAVRNYSCVGLGDELFTTWEDDIISVMVAETAPTILYALDQLFKLLDKDELIGKVHTFTLKYVNMTPELTSKTAILVSGATTEKITIFMYNELKNMEETDIAQNSYGKIEIYCNENLNGPVKIVLTMQGSSDANFMHRTIKFDENGKVTHIICVDSLDSKNEQVKTISELNVLAQAKTTVNRLPLSSDIIDTKTMTVIKAGEVYRAIFGNEDFSKFNSNIKNKFRGKTENFVAEIEVEF